MQQRYELSFMHWGMRCEGANELWDFVWTLVKHAWPNQAKA
jgi:hypothetical protein